MPRLIAFVGYHNSGKTTIIRRLIHELERRGYSCGIIKSTKEAIEPLKKDGSDTDLFRRDGIKKICLVTPHLTCHINYGERPNLNLLADTFFQDCDIVIAEGFKNEKDIKKIEVTRRSISSIPLKDKVNGVIAAITDYEIPGIPNFSFEDIDKICDFLEERLKLTKDPNRLQISLYVNERNIPLKKFVRESLSKTILGYISALKFTENAKDITLRIKLS